MLPRVAHPREGPTWITQLIGPIQWFSAEGNFAPGGIWHCLQTVWIFTTWRGKEEWCCWHQWVEARGTEKHTKVHRSAPTTKNSLSQDVESAEIENVWPDQMFQKNPSSAQVLQRCLCGLEGVALPPLGKAASSGLTQPACALGRMPRPGRSPSSLTIESPGGQHDGGDFGGHCPGPGPPQPGSAFSWRPTLHSFLQFSVLYSHLKNIVEVNEVLPSVSFTFVTLVTKRRIRKRLNPNCKSLVAPPQLRPAPQARLLLKERGGLCWGPGQGPPQYIPQWHVDYFDFKLL